MGSFFLILGIICVVLAAALLFVFKIVLPPPPSPSPSPSPIWPSPSAQPPQPTPVPQEYYYYRATRYLDCQQDSGIGEMIVRSTLPYTSCEWLNDGATSYQYYGKTDGPDYDVEGNFTNGGCASMEICI